MKKVIMGNHAASWGVLLSRVQVIAAYPITPQTQIVEELSEMCADGRLAAKFIKVESEHSALASIIGASAAGARAFTATSAQGLALMHELLHWAAGARLPIVMVNVNRAMAPGWSIWSDQNDSLSQRDTGWMQFYCEDNQEVLDTVIMSYRIAESVQLPVMVCYDAFILSHTYEPVDIPDQKLVDDFLPSPPKRFVLNPEDPRAFYSLVMPDHYMEFRYKVESAMQKAKGVIEEVGKEFEKSFGRRYGLVDTIGCEDAEVVLVTSGSSTSPARVAVKTLREKGHKVGLLKVKTFRPFPAEKVREILAGRKSVAVVDRNISFGKGGIFADELKGALFNLKSKPKVYEFIVGLGGRDITPEIIEEILLDTIGSKVSESEVHWKGLKP